MDLPEHAVAEIAAAKGAEKATLRRFWESWAKIGDAKEARREAFERLVDAEKLLPGVPRSRRAQVVAKVRAAEEELAAADEAIAADIRRHKAVK